MALCKYELTILDYCRHGDIPEIRGAAYNQAIEVLRASGYIEGNFDLPTTKGLNALKEQTK